ncbi:alpha/beta fold hydrolase [Gandjariella thermophila]|uniref:Lipase n=1 Tax=Gandjariella thermophila TaxID=1931992 RepID=A0A4D4JCT4_9PSEU|nr:alpha/beta hydrolase [Gandjariella thermophila]GDY32810.1 lipase [Gandjariella thermophila]
MTRPSHPRPESGRHRATARPRASLLGLAVSAGLTVTRTALRLATVGLARDRSRGPAAVAGENAAVPLRGRARHETTVVTAEDGVRLHVEIDGPPNAPVTVVLCHGYALNAESWYFQRAALAREARVVTWDHRGHGRSERARSGGTTIEMLGRDLFTVLERTAPKGPVVLAGHSMGGMAILTLAAAHPELFGRRVTGVALLATSAGPVNASLGLPPQAATAVNWAALRVISAVARLPALPRSSPAVRELTLLLSRRCSFASDVPRALVAFLADMIHATPLDVVVDLLPRFAGLNAFAALPVLRRVETLVLAAANDLITSPEHSRVIAEAVPGADLVVVPNAGHAVLLEHPALVTGYLLDLINRAAGAPDGEGRAEPVS